MITFERSKGFTTISFQIPDDQLPDFEGLIKRVEGMSWVRFGQSVDAPQTRGNLTWVSWILHKLIGPAEPQAPARRPRELEGGPRWAGKRRR